MLLEGKKREYTEAHQIEEALDVAVWHSRLKHRSVFTAWNMHRTCGGEKLTPLWQDDLIRAWWTRLSSPHIDRTSVSMWKLELSKLHCKKCLESNANDIKTQEKFPVGPSLRLDILWNQYGCFSKVNDPVSTAVSGSYLVKSYICISKWSIISKQHSLLALKFISFKDKMNITRVFIYSLHNE